MPLVSVIADVPAVRMLPTAVLPVMVGWPVAALFVGAVAVAVVPALVRVSAFPSSSVKDTRTLMVLSSSALTRT